MSGISREGQFAAVKRSTDGVREFFAYFDESGTHDSAPAVVLSGLLGSAEDLADLLTVRLLVVIVVPPDQLAWLTASPEARG